MNFSIICTIQTEIDSERGRDIDDDGDNEGDEAITMKMKIDIILSSPPVLKDNDNRASHQTINNDGILV